MARFIKKLVPIPDYRLFIDELPLCEQIMEAQREKPMVLLDEMALLSSEMTSSMTSKYADDAEDADDDDNVGNDTFGDAFSRWKIVLRSRERKQAEIQRIIDGKIEDLRSLHGRDYAIVMSNWAVWRSLIPKGEDLSEEDVIAGSNALLVKSDSEPLRISSNTWIFKGSVYEVRGAYSYEQSRLLVLEDFDEERKYFEKLKQKHDDSAHATSVYVRPRVPENVRIEVWRRDGGKCVRCGSRESLEYDHIIPIAKGGSNTTRNIELLCEMCNRSKGANIV